MPLSYQGFGFTALMLMLAVLVAGQAIRHLKNRYHKGQDARKQRPQHL